MGKLKGYTPKVYIWTDKTSPTWPGSKVQPTSHLHEVAVLVDDRTGRPAAIFDHNWYEVSNPYIDYGRYVKENREGDYGEFIDGGKVFQEALDFAIERARKSGAYPKIFEEINPFAPGESRCR